MRLADALVTALRDWGVAHVFGVSGANIEHLHDAIHRLGDDRLTSVMAKSEVGAAFMADGHARVHRTLGVCCATSGGGMMNLAVGVAEAYNDSVPVLAIVGQVPTTLEGRGGFQDSSGRGRTVDAAQMWRAITKYTAKITRPEQFWPALQEAVAAALGGRPGPAALLIPRDLYDAEVGDPPADLPARLPRPGAGANAPDAHAVRSLFERMRDATHPVLVLGTGVNRCTDPQAVIDFARAAGVPVMSTIAGTGSFPNSDPLYLGTIGVAGHPSAHAYLNDVADLIVAVGTGLGVMVRGAIAPALEGADLAVVNLDPDAAAACSPSLVVEADAGDAFAALGELQRAEPFRAPPVESYRHTRYQPTLAAPVAPQSHNPRAVGGQGLLRQSQAIWTLNHYLPDAGHLVFDAGNCAAAALHFLDVPDATTATIALGMGGMGYAIAASIGVQLGSAPDCRTTVLCGDGAFLMLGTEIHTAVELGLPILFVVFNNGRHGMCVTRQQLMFDGRVECAEYQMPRVAAIARSLGAPNKLWVGGAGTEQGLVAALDDYHGAARPGPGVLELRLLQEELPPFAPFLPADAETYQVTAAGHKRASRSAA